MPPVDYDALAAQHGGTAVVDYDALAAQHGGTVANSQQEGLLHSFGAQVGISPENHPGVQETVVNGLLGPAGTMARGLYQQGKQSFDQMRQAYQSAKEGNASGVAQHAITAVPIVGPALDKATDQYADKNYMGETGTLLGAAANAAPLVMGAVDAAGVPRPNSSIPNMMSKFPTRAKAVEIFSDLNTKLKEQPVALDSSAAPLQRAIEIAARGGTMPTPVKALLERSQAIEPMTFPEARDYQMSLSDLSASDKLAMNNRMRGAVEQLNKALYRDVRQAAESGGGMGADFDKAMTEYRQASQIRDVLRNTGKTAVKGAVTAAAGATAYSLLKDIQASR